MSLTLPGMILIPLIILSFFAKRDRMMAFFVVLAAMSTVSIMHVGGSDIMAYHLMLVVCVIRYVISSRGKLIIPRFNALFFFVLYSGVSMIWTAFINDAYIITIDGSYGLAVSSFQQVTQYLYLLFGFLTYIVITQYLREDSNSWMHIEKALSIAYLVVLAIGIMQMVLPVGIINTFFRNAVNANFKYQGARVSSTFLEPSVFSLFTVPLFISTLMKLTKKFNIIDFICIVLNIIIVARNNSSTFYLGIIIAVIGGVVLMLRDLVSSKKVSVNKIRNILIGGGVYCF